MAKRLCQPYTNQENRLVTTEVSEKSVYLVAQSLVALNTTVYVPLQKLMLHYLSELHCGLGENDIIKQNTHNSVAELGGFQTPTVGIYALFKVYPKRFLLGTLLEHCARQAVMCNPRGVLIPSLRNRILHRRLVRAQSSVFHAFAITLPS